MFTWSHFFLGIMLTIVGTVLLKFNYAFVGYTGRQDWIERYMGSGSTYLAYQIFAIVLTICGLLTATGLGGSVMGWILSPFQSIFHSLSG
jgi:hypothetical protein